MNKHRSFSLFATAVVVWVLLTPPSTYSPTWKTGNHIDTSLPLSKWITMGEYPTELECEIQRREMMLILALTNSGGDMAKRLNLGRCVLK